MALQDIETIVIVILENRSFDHMVGYLSLPSANPPMPVDGLRDDPAWLAAQANKASQGQPIAPYKLMGGIQAMLDPPHDLPAITGQIDTPAAFQPPAKMGGFVQSYEGKNPDNKQLVMGWYGADAVPTFDFLARNFAICDNWFSSLPTGTQPNRLIAMSGKSSLKDNATGPLPNQPLVYEWLSKNKIHWCTYQWGGIAGHPFFFLMPKWTVKILLSLSDPFNSGSFRRYDGFHDQWTADAPMPSVIFIEPKYTDDPIGWPAPNDDHPPTGIAKGQDFVRRIYQTLISNPTRWANTMMIVTYDEHGGFFDHVPPLPIKDKAQGHQFQTTGPRVPALVVSPHVAPGTVFHGKLDHTSILRLLAERFTPDKPYSDAVTARQQTLDALSTILPAAPPAHPRIPQIPDNIHAFVQVEAAIAPVAPVGPGAPRDTETAKAFDQVANELARTRPDLLATPAGQVIAAYVTGTAPSGGTVGLEAVMRAVGPAKTKPKRKAKGKVTKPRKPARPRRKRPGRR
jgi:phospholipase C